jgi:hypothetical protein
MNFIPFFFLTYLMGRNQCCDCDSDPLPSISLADWTGILFTIITGAIASWGFFLSMPTSATSDAPRLSTALEVLNVFLPCIIMLGTFIIYSCWENRVGEISQKAACWSLLAGALFTLITLFLRIYGIAGQLLPNTWLLVRTCPALTVPILLVIFDGLVKWRATKSHKR